MLFGLVSILSQLNKQHLWNKNIFLKKLTQDRESAIQLQVRDSKDPQMQAPG